MSADLNYVRWGEVSFIGIDNSVPPQLWAWYGEQDEAAEPLFKIDGRELVEYIKRLLQGKVRASDHFGSNALRKAGVPSQTEMYRRLKAESVKLQGKVGEADHLNN